MPFAKGARVSFPFGLEARATGRVVRGPYPAPATFREFQKREYGHNVATVYDVKSGPIGVATIGARFVRSATKGKSR